MYKYGCQRYSTEAQFSMVTTGVLLAALSGICNGLFTAPMKMIPRWKWENIWLVFIVVACLVMPVSVVTALGVDIAEVLRRSPNAAIVSAIAFGFAWGFGSILFGLSVDRLGVSLSNTLVIGLSSALGALVPMILRGGFQMGAQQWILMIGVVCFLCGVGLCGVAGRRRDASAGSSGSAQSPSLAGYFFAVGAGVMSAVFNIGYTLAMPIAQSGEALGYSGFAATNLIWLLMLGAGAIPNIGFCSFLLIKHKSFANFGGAVNPRTWGLSALMGLLWGGSIFLYGAATPMLGNLGTAIGWPLSLAVALLVANAMGLMLGEWREVSADAVRPMRRGIVVLILAILLCAASSQV